MKVKLIDVVMTSSNTKFVYFEATIEEKRLFSTKEVTIEMFRYRDQPICNEVLSTGKSVYSLYNLDFDRTISAMLYKRYPELIN